MMKGTPAAANPDAYVAALGGWQGELVAWLRSIVQSSADFEEVIKWGHLVYFANGPVLLIRAEPTRVLFGFWRGKRLLHIEPRLYGAGKYEMKTLEMHADTPLMLVVARRLVQEAHALNRSLGNPTRRTD